MTKTTWRAFLSGAAALLATSLSAKSSNWQAVMNKARGVVQLRAILIFNAGKQVLAEEVRGPNSNPLVPIKSVSKTLVEA